MSEAKKIYRLLAVPASLEINFSTIEVGLHCTVVFMLNRLACLYPS